MHYCLIWDFWVPFPSPLNDSQGLRLRYSNPPPHGFSSCWLVSNAYNYSTSANMSKSCWKKCSYIPSTAEFVQWGLRSCNGYMVLVAENVAMNCYKDIIYIHVKGLRMWFWLLHVQHLQRLERSAEIVQNYLKDFTCFHLWVCKQVLLSISAVSHAFQLEDCWNSPELSQGHHILPLEGL
jgi:hypothetical protein